MQLFDSVARQDAEPKGDPISQFAYLNLSGRPEACRVREALQAFFDRYPADHKGDLIGKIRSARDDQHISGVFELTLHELFLRHSLKVLEIEPALDHTPKTPDFLLQAPSGQELFVEAVVSMGKSQRDAAAHTRVDEAIAALRQVKSRKYYLSVRVEGAPTESISRRELISTVQAWLDAIENEVTVAEHSRRGGPKLDINRKGLRLIISLMARTPKNEPSSALGMWLPEAGSCTPGAGIREALEEKSTRYGDLKRPYFIAVNSVGMSRGEESTVDALLGSPCCVLTKHADGSLTDRWTRSPDGAWCDAKGPRNTGVSGVLSFDGLTAWSLGRCGSRVVHNPWARHPLIELSLPLFALVPRGDEFDRVAGETLAGCLGLEAEWPEVAAA